MALIWSSGNAPLWWHIIQTTDNWYYEIQKALTLDHSLRHRRCILRRNLQVDVLFHEFHFGQLSVHQLSRYNLLYRWKQQTWKWIYNSNFHLINTGPAGWSYFKRKQSVLLRWTIDHVEWPQESKTTISITALQKNPHSPINGSQQLRNIMREGR